MNLGKSKRQPKSVFDVELMPSEPIDDEDLEVQCMAKQIRGKKEEPQPLKVKRLRNNSANIEFGNSSNHSFWH